MAVVLIPLDGGVFGRAVHPFDLAVDPGMIGFRHSVLYPIGNADHVKPHKPRIGRIPIVRLLCELDNISGHSKADGAGSESSGSS